MNIVWQDNIVLNSHTAKKQVKTGEQWHNVNLSARWSPVMGIQVAEIQHEGTTYRNVPTSWYLVEN